MSAEAPAPRFPGKVRFRPWLALAVFAVLVIATLAVTSARGLQLDSSESHFHLSMAADSGFEFAGTEPELRHPIGAWALDWTRAQVAIMRPDPHARAIASVIRDLMQTRDATTYFVGKMSGMLMRYNLPGDHPLTGCSAPDFEFEDGTRLGGLLHDSKGLLLDFTEAQELDALGQTRKERLKYASTKVKDNKGLTAVLVRPDGFVAWATESKPDAIAAEESMERWFGGTT